MMQDDNESAENKNQQNESNMLESEGSASPIDNQSDPMARQRAASGPDSSDNDLMEINEQLPNGQMRQKANLFDNEEDDSDDKQQLVDNLEDMMHQAPRGSNMRADRVGDVIGNELDIEFDEEIQDNIQGRRTGGSSAEQKDDDDEIVDPDDVNIIVDGDQDYEEEDQSDAEEDDRNLNRKTDNMADYKKRLL